MDIRRNSEPEVQESRQSFGDLLMQLGKQVSALIKDEIALGKAQLDEKAAAYSSAAFCVGVGIVLGLLSALAFMSAGIIALGNRVGLVLSSVIFGAALALPALVLISRGRKRFRHHV